MRWNEKQTTGHIKQVAARATSALLPMAATGAREASRRSEVAQVTMVTEAMRKRFRIFQVDQIRVVSPAMAKVDLLPYLMLSS